VSQVGGAGVGWSARPSRTRSRWTSPAGWATCLRPSRSRSCRRRPADDHPRAAASANGSRSMSAVRKFAASAPGFPGRHGHCAVRTTPSARNNMICAVPHARPAHYSAARNRRYARFKPVLAGLAQLRCVESAKARYTTETRHSGADSHDPVRVDARNVRARLFSFRRLMGRTWSSKASPCGSLSRAAPPWRSIDGQAILGPLLRTMNQPLSEAIRPLTCCFTRSPGRIRTGAVALTESAL